MTESTRALAWLPPGIRAVGPPSREGDELILPVQDPSQDQVMVLRTLSPHCKNNAQAANALQARARTAARLQHPGIPPIHTLGSLIDGRPYSLERLNRGVPFSAIVKALATHAAHPGAAQDPEPWPFYRVINALHKAAEAITYAHENGVFHGAISPDTLRLGDFGEVIVVGWGAAVTASQRGKRPGPAARDDIVSMGRLLYSALFPTQPAGGQAPFPGDALSGHGQLDHRSRTEIIQTCQRALSRAGGFESMAELSEALRRWLEHRAKREEALQQVQEADRKASQLAQLRVQVKALREDAATQLQGVAPEDPIERKRPGWQLEDQANALERQADLQEVTYLQALRSALMYDADLAEVHDRLASYYRGRLEEAEAEGDQRSARKLALLIEEHDRTGAHRSFLKGTGALTLHTSPPGARATLYRNKMIRRRLVPVFERRLGLTPLIELPMEMGSYVVKLEADDHQEVLYPIFIGRGEHWHGVKPGETEPTPIWLPPTGALSAAEAYVPAGFFHAGGDVKAPATLPHQRVWVDAFVLQTFPVTVSAYFDFLNDLLREGREAEALLFAPALGRGDGGSGRLEPISGAAGDLRFAPPIHCDRLRWELDRPIGGVDWIAAVSYAEWHAERTGQAWSLPGEIEWEKAARGVDGRIFPWGDFEEATWCANAFAAQDLKAVQAVDSFPVDQSPYGLRGMAANVSDWCWDVFKTKPAPQPQDVYVAPGMTPPWRAAPFQRSEDANPTPEDQRIRSYVRHLKEASWPFRVIRGGNWELTIFEARLATRHQVNPWRTGADIGFRLCRRLPYQGISG